MLFYELFWLYKKGTGCKKPRAKLINPFGKEKCYFKLSYPFSKFNHISKFETHLKKMKIVKLKKLHKYTHLNIELLKASNSEKMDHNIEWGNLYFLTASSKGLAVIILTWNSITSFHCSCILFMFLCKKALHSARFGEIFFHSVRFWWIFLHNVRFGEFSVCLV